MSDSVRPLRRQPTRLPRPWDSPGKNTGVGCHFLLQCMKMKVKSLSPVRLFATPWSAASQALSSMGFSRLEWGAIALEMLQIELLATPQGQVSWFLLHFLRGSSTVRTHQHLRLNPDSDSFPRYSKLKTICRDFLVGQWLRLRAPKTGGPVQSMVRELDSTCGPDPGRPNKYLLKKKKHCSR